MTASAIQATVSQLTAMPKPSERDVASAIGSTFQQAKDNRFWRFLEAQPVPAPYQRVELRLSKSDPKGLVVLTLAEGQPISEADLAFPTLGAPELEVNPRIPPEGTIDHVYRGGAAKLSVQFTARSKQLRQIAIEWE